MSQEAVDMGGIDAYLAIVPVMSMAGGAENPRSNRRRHFNIFSAQ